MKQFSVFRNPSETSRGFAPFIVVLQSHHLSLDTVLVAPLVNDKRATSIEIGVIIEGRLLVVALTEIGSVRVAYEAGERPLPKTVRLACGGARCAGAGRVRAAARRVWRR